MTPEHTCADCGRAIVHRPTDIDGLVYVRDYFWMAMPSRNRHCPTGTGHRPAMPESLTREAVELWLDS